MVWVSSLNHEFNLSSIINLFSSSLDRPEEIPARYPPPFPHLSLESCLSSQKHLSNKTSPSSSVSNLYANAAIADPKFFCLQTSGIDYDVFSSWGVLGLNLRGLLVHLSPLTVDPGVLLFPWTVSQLQPAIPTSVSPGGLQPPAWSAAAAAIPAAW